MDTNNQIETELRAPIDSDLIEEKGYLPSKVSIDHDIYYSYQLDKDRTWIARIRNKNGKRFLTFKSSKRFGDGAWDEVDIKISSKHALKLNDFFLNNGFFIDVEIKKKRKTYIIEDMEVNIDYIENLGTFIEAEIMTTEENIHHAKTKIQDFFNSLNINPKKVIAKGYVPLMREKLNHYGLKVHRFG